MALGAGGGQQVGACGGHALLWTGSAASCVDLTPFAGWTAEAWATNGSQQVGTGGPLGTYEAHALVWSGSAGSCIDLNAFLPPGFIGSVARGIDEEGRIVGRAFLEGGAYHAVMWVPTLSWTGSIDNKWNAGLAANWSRGVAVAYKEGDHVVFCDTSAPTAQVDITTTVNPGSVVVNNSATAFELGGAGSIAGASGLTKDGTGALTLATHNAYTGETRINAGTVIVAAEGALGASAVRLGDTTGSSNAGLLVAGAFTVDRNITVQDDGSASSTRTLGGTNTSGTAVFSGGITLDRDLTLTAAPGGAVRLAGALDNSEGHTITKVGGGTVIFDAFQTHGPGALLDVDAGTVYLNTDAGSGTSANLSITVTDAVVRFGANQHLDTLNIGDGGEVVFAGAHVVVLKHLVMGGIDFGATTLTPEPATLSLLALGGALALLRRRSASS